MREFGRIDLMSQTPWGQVDKAATELLLCEGVEEVVLEYTLQKDTGGQQFKHLLVRAQIDGYLVAPGTPRFNTLTSVDTAARWGRFEGVASYAGPALYSLYGRYNTLRWIREGWRFTVLRGAHYLDGLAVPFEIADDWLV